MANDLVPDDVEESPCAPGGTITRRQLADVIRTCRGNLLAVSRQLGITRRAVGDRIAHSPALQRIVDEARESRIDRAEQTLDGAVEEGDLNAALFVLRTIGRKRGYVTEDSATTTVRVNVIEQVYTGDPAPTLSRIAEEPPAPQVQNPPPSIAQDEPSAER